MASHPEIPSKIQQEAEGEEQSQGRHNAAFVSSLPEDNRWAPLRKYQGFWFLESCVPVKLAMNKGFVARPSDVYVASFPKSGTTWLKSLVFSIVHRGRHPPHDEGHPLRGASPHDLVNMLEILYSLRKDIDLAALPSPRILSTHNPFSVLPESMKSSGCRIIYVAREPKDNFVSLWHFAQNIKREGTLGGVITEEGRAISMEDAFDMFCSGISVCGPIWEHALEYWNEHLRHPDKVLFLKYEAMKEDPVETLKGLAAFLGCPFSEDEETQGVPAGITELCGFRNLSNLEVNKDGLLSQRPMQKKLFFRRGEVGDWANHLTPEMVEKLDGITHEKLRDSGLSF